MRSVAGMGPSSPPEDFSLMKQRSYINMVVSLLCKCSERRDVRQNDFIQPVQQMLKDVQIYSSRGMMNQLFTKFQEKKKEAPISHWEYFRGINADERYHDDDLSVVGEFVAGDPQFTLHHFL